MNARTIPSTLTTPRIVGWQRQLEDGRVEIFVKSESAGLKVRAHGSAEQMNGLLDWFESGVGCVVDAPWRTRTGPKPIIGQLDLMQDDEYAEAGA